jgi:hypothetical protein
MDRRDEEFETFLRQFQPRRPSALPYAPSLRPAWWSRRLLAAAVIVLVCGSALLVLRLRTTVNRPPPTRLVVQQEVPTPLTSSVAETVTLGKLTQRALMDLDGLDGTLRDVSRNLLPHVERSESTLHALAKE